MAIESTRARIGAVAGARATTSLARLLRDTNAATRHARYSPKSINGSPRVFDNAELRTQGTDR